MASRELDVNERDGDETSNCSETTTEKLFKCCSKQCKVMMCMNCESFFHEGCVRRMKNAVYKSDSLIICCQQNQTSEKKDVNNSEQEVSELKLSKLELENSYLKQIIHEIQGKNSILLQNNSLLLEKINVMESRQNYAPSMVPYENRHIQTSGGNNTEYVMKSPQMISTKKKSVTVKDGVNVPNICIEQLIHNESQVHDGKKVNKESNDNRKSNPASKKLMSEIMKPNIALSLASVPISKVNKQHNMNNFEQGNSSEIISKNVTANVRDYANESEEGRINKHFEDIDESEWKKVIYGKKKHTLKKERPQPIKGEKGETNLLAAKQLSCLFLTGLKPETTPEQVKNYISETFNLNGTCEKMKTRKDIYKSSFKIYVPYESKEMIMNPSKWEKGISLNHFLHLRRYLPREN